MIRKFSTVKRFLATTLLIAIVLSEAACSGGGRMNDQSGQAADAVPIVRESGIEPAAVDPSNKPSRRNMSPAEISAGSTEGADATGTELKECVSQSCRINCSPRLAQSAKPQWCQNFKEPTVAR